MWMWTGLGGQGKGPGSQASQGGAPSEGRRGVGSDWEYKGAENRQTGTAQKAQYWQRISLFCTVCKSSRITLLFSCCTRVANAGVPPLSAQHTSQTGSKRGWDRACCCSVVPSSQTLLQNVWVRDPSFFPFSSSTVVFASLILPFLSSFFSFSHRVWFKAAHYWHPARGSSRNAFPCFFTCQLAFFCS